MDGQVQERHHNALVVGQRNHGDTVVCRAGKGGVEKEGWEGGRKKKVEKWVHREGKKTKGNQIRAK